MWRWHEQGTRNKTENCIDRKGTNEKEREETHAEKTNELKVL